MALLFNRLKEKFMSRLGIWLLTVLLGTMMLVITASMFYRFGQQSVKQIDKVCPEQKEKLISSSHSNAGTICVYQEPWKRKGKIKRIEL
jgi:hypothetical protein